jgi:hypothetical protein
MAAFSTAAMQVKNVSPIHAPSCEIYSFSHEGGPTGREDFIYMSQLDRGDGAPTLLLGALDGDMGEAIEKRLRELGGK